MAPSKTTNGYILSESPAKLQDSLPKSSSKLPAIPSSSTIARPHHIVAQNSASRTVMTDLRPVLETEQRTLSNDITNNRIKALSPINLTRA